MSIKIEYKEGETIVNISEDYSDIKEFKDKLKSAELNINAKLTKILEENG